MNIIMGNKLLLFTSQLLFVSVFSAAVDNKLQINATRSQSHNDIQNIESKGIQEEANSIQQSSDENNQKANIHQSSSATITTTVAPAESTKTTTQKSTTTRAPITNEATTATVVKSTTTKETKDLSNEIDDSTTVATTERTPQQTTKSFKRNCVNNVHEARCVQIKRYWQSRFDVCKSFRVMRVLCRKFCGLCGTTEIAVQFSPQKPQIQKEKPKRRCREFSKIFCQRFKSHCEEEGRNGKRMRRHCQRTCNSC